MAIGKKSFQLYTEWIEIFDELDNEEAGQLIKHIFNYVNDKNPTVKDRVIKLSFIQIKQQLKRDLMKWEDKCEVNRANGALGGRPKKPKITERLISKPKKPDKVEDKDKDKDISVKRFTTPHINDIKNYFLERTQLRPLSNTEGEKFYDFYSSKNWMIGRNKMKDWKAAARNWLRRLSESENDKPQPIKPMDTSGKSEVDKQIGIDQIKRAYEKQRS